MGADRLVLAREDSGPVTPSPAPQVTKTGTRKRLSMTRRPLSWELKSYAHRILDSLTQKSVLASILEQ
jgi:hypothetical protein